MERTAGQHRRGSARGVLPSLALSMLLSSLGVSIANVALPTVAEAFSAPVRQVQWVVIGYLLATTVSVVSVGRLGDRLGHRRVLLAGILLFTLASVLCGAAPDLRSLVAARVIQGIGAAILLTVAMAMVKAAVPKAQTGTAMGLLGTMSAVGTALGPSLGGVILAGGGWRLIFLILGLLGALNLVIAGRYLPAAEPGLPTRHGDFDLVGTALLSLTLAAYALAMTVGVGRMDQLNLVLLLVAVASGACFLFVEARVGTPLIALAMFRNAGLGAGLAMNLLVGTVMMATLVVGPFYLARGLGLGHVLLGAVMSVGPLVSALSGVPAGRIVDGRGAPFVLRAGLAAMAAGALGLSTLPQMFGLPGYIAAIVMLTPGYQMFQAANNTQVMTGIGPDQSGVVSGLLNLSRNLGLLTGASAMGALFAIASDAGPTAASTPDAISAGLRITFAVAAGLVLAALATAIASSLLANRRGSLSDR